MITLENYHNYSNLDLQNKLDELDKYDWNDLSEENKLLRNTILDYVSGKGGDKSLNDYENSLKEKKLIQQSQFIKLTTANSFVNQEVLEELEIITAECVFGMNVFRDFFAGMTDFFGGRSEASQKVLRDARQNCLRELKIEAARIEADGVLGVDLDYSEISGKGKGMLFLVASGTAVKFKK